MNRRPFLHSLVAGGVLLTTGCTESVPFTFNQPDASNIFENHRFEGTDLIVTFRDGVDVQSTVLYNSTTDEEYETVEHPSETARFQVVFPNRLETYIANSLHVKAKTSDGWASRWIPETIHASVESIEVLSDGRARIEIVNLGDAPLLIRFVGIYRDVPNPTIAPQSESVDRSELPFNPGVLGVGPNRPLSPSRTDLVVPSGETALFETTYAPFAFPNGANAEDCNGDERTGEITVVHAAGGSAAYTFSFYLEGEPTTVEGQTAGICNTTTIGEI